MWASVPHTMMCGNKQTNATGHDITQGVSKVQHEKERALWWKLYL